MTEEKKKRFLKVAKTVIDRLEKENVVVRPQDLVDVARPKHSPLHSLFVWDDSEAAESYRRHQAGQLIARCRVYYKDGRNERGFQKVKVKVKYNGDERVEEGYVSTARIVADKELRLQTIKKGIDELNRWKNKYSAYEELMALINKNQMGRIKITI